MARTLSSSYHSMDSEPHAVSVFSDLPYELFCYIILQLANDTPTLLSVCLTGKALYKEAVPYIYRYIENGRSEPLHLQLLPVLISNPKLAALVHVYHSDTIAKRHTVNARRAEGPRQIWNLTLQAIPLMINLQRLRFRDWNGLSSAQILKTARFQLIDFDWGCAFEGKELADFLATQKNLKHIVFAPDSYRCALDPEACQTVKSIAGSYATISNLLPGRSGVEHLRWMPDQGEHQYWSEDLVSGSLIGERMHRVVSLSLGGFGVRPLLPYFGSTITSLKTLELYNIDIQVELPFIFKLASLETLVVSASWDLAWTTIFTMTREAMIRVLFASCQSLQVVFFEDGSSFSDRYQYWKRGWQEPRIVNWPYRYRMRFFGINMWRPHDIRPYGIHLPV